jgi:hypothetical protein
MSGIRTTTASGQLPPSRRGAAPKPPAPPPVSKKEPPVAQPRLPVPGKPPEPGPSALERRQTGAEPAVVWTIGHLDELDPLGPRRFFRLTGTAAASGTAWSRWSGVDFELLPEPLGWNDLTENAQYLVDQDDAGEDRYRRLMFRGPGFRAGLDTPPTGRRARLPRPLDWLGTTPAGLLWAVRKKGIIVTFDGPGGTMLLRATGGVDVGTLVLLERARPFLEAEHRGAPLRCQWPHSGEAPIASMLTWPGLACCDPAAHELKPEPKPTGLRRVIAALGVKP